MKVPTSTYRLQLNADFRLAHVRELIPYFSDLGVSHLYLSPIFQARPRSPHGYDVTNPGQINREIGDENEFFALSRMLHEAGIGLILDIVPNHMAADAQNPWWRDVLEQGPASLAGRFFDIEWRAPGSPGRLVLPVLAQELADAVNAGEINVTHVDGELQIRYFDRLFPLDPATYALVLEGLEGTAALLKAATAIPSRSARTAEQKQQRREASLALKTQLRHWLADPRNKEHFDRKLDALAAPALLALLDRQAYSLEFWRTGTERLNYRRFFDVNDLAAVRVEDPDVFATTHALILELVRTRQIDGLRVDHVDGLRDPAGYLQDLRAAIDDSYVVVEKILAPTEDLPDYWPIEGTTGYDFLGIVTALYCHAEGLARLGDAYLERTGMPPYPEVVYEKKKLAIEKLFGSELRSLTTTLTQALVNLEIDGALVAQCITEVTAAMHVYRTYIAEDVDAYDRAVIKHAVTTARHRAPDVPDALFAALRNLLVGEDVAASIADVRARFIADWQQFTGPVTAKGLEDTAFYAYHRLIAQCEVGAQPDAELASAAEFHAVISRRARRWPYAMNASSTHDTKRSEDVRARIAVLSELPEVWQAALDRWTRVADPLRVEMDGLRFPTANDQELIFQTLVGVWPLDGSVTALLPRLRVFLQKAAREAKTCSSWTDPNQAYEKALYDFVAGLIENADFVTDFQRLHDSVAWYGALNSLSQLTLKLAAPGVPDIYQGNESWAFNLVDPDNRRPVDYLALQEMITALPGEFAAPDVAQLLRAWRDGRIKLHVTRTALHLRNQRRQLFEHGEYVPIEVRGRLGSHVVAFARKHNDDWAILAVARFFSSLLPRPFGDVWRDTHLVLPSNAPLSWRNSLTNEVTDGAQLEGVFATLPFAILTGMVG